jgi:hypothetical protein
VTHVNGKCHGADQEKPKSQQDEKHDLTGLALVPSTDPLERGFHRFTINASIHDSTISSRVKSHTGPS